MGVIYKPLPKPKPLPNGDCFLIIPFQSGWSIHPALENEYLLECALKSIYYDDDRDFDDLLCLCLEGVSSANDLVKQSVYNAVTSEYAYFIEVLGDYKDDVIDFIEFCGRPEDVVLKKVTRGLVMYG